MASPSPQPDRLLTARLGSIVSRAAAGDPVGHLCVVLADDAWQRVRRGDPLRAASRAARAVAAIDAAGARELLLASGGAPALRWLSHEADPAEGARLRATWRAVLAALRDAPLPVGRLIELALYGPTGFYTAGAPGIGSTDAFTTSPEASPLFARALARALIGLWRDLGGPADFDVVEVGGGTGQLAADLLAAWESLAPGSRPRYTIVEASPALRERQRRRLAGLGCAIVAGSALDLPIGRVRGALISNELVDALPGSLLVGRPDGPRELCVALRRGRLVEVDGPPASAELTAGLPAPLVDGERHYVRPAARRWMAAAGRALARGAIVTIDYGGGAAELAREGRSLPRTYGRGVEHGPLDELYRRPGAVDVTADVDFDALVEAGAAVGLAAAPLESQRDFLLRHGLAGDLAALRRAGDERGYERGCALIDAYGHFRVLVQRT